MKPEKTPLEETQFKAAALNRLLESSHEKSSDWSRADLAAMLEHQLTIPLDVSFDQEDEHQTINSLTDVPENFGAVLSHDKAPLVLLRLMKDFAKRLLSAKERPLPVELLQVLYYAPLAAALVRRDMRISSLPDKSLLKGFRWCLKQEWINADLKQLFEDALYLLKQNGSIATE